MCFIRFAARSRRKSWQEGRRRGHSSNSRPCPPPTQGGNVRDTIPVRNKRARDDKGMKHRRFNLFENLVRAVKAPCSHRCSSSGTASAPSLAFPGVKAVLCLHGKGICSQRNPNKRSDDPSGSLAGHLQPKLSSPTPSFPILPCHLARISCVGFFLLIQDQVKKV